MMTRFCTPTIEATPAALAVLSRLGADPMALVRRHYAGEWGAEPINCEANEGVLEQGTGTLLSLFEVCGEAVWVFSLLGTSDDYTTVLLPGEYPEDVDDQGENLATTMDVR